MQTKPKSQPKLSSEEVRQTTNGKSVLSQRIDSALYAEIKKYAEANTEGNRRIATERLLRQGLDSMDKKTFRL
jgi:hypothetical protein